MKILKLLFICITFLTFSVPSIGSASNFKYYSKSPTLDEMKQIMDFKIFEPTKYDPEWILTIKPHPDDIKRAKSFTMHFYIENKELFLSITQSKEYFYKRDVERRNLPSIKINDQTGYFEEWGAEYDRKGNIIGGLLRWEQEGTYLEMRSVNIPKDKMLIIAETLKEISN